MRCEEKKWSAPGKNKRPDDFNLFKHIAQNISLHIILLHDRSDCSIACPMFSNHWTGHCRMIPGLHYLRFYGCFCSKRIINLPLQILFLFLLLSVGKRQSQVTAKSTELQNFVIGNVQCLSGPWSWEFRFYTFSVMQCAGLWQVVFFLPVIKTLGR